MKDLLIYYGVTFGKDDSSETFIREAYMNDKQYEAFMEGVMIGEEPEFIDILEPLLQKAYDEIEQEEIQNLVDKGDEDVIKYVNEGKSPFDYIYDLDVRFSSLDELEITDEDAAEYVRECFEKGKLDLAKEVAQYWVIEADEPKTFGLDEKLEKMILELINVENGEQRKLSMKLDTFVEEHEDFYSGYLYEYAFEQAVIYGLYSYVDEHAYDVDLNDGDDGECRHFANTDDPEMIEILKDNGAMWSYEDYADEHRLVIDSGEWEILSFKESLQKQVFEEYLMVREYSERDIINILRVRDKEKYKTVLEELEMMGIDIIKDEICFLNMEGKGGGDLMDLVEELGYTFEFDGTENKMFTEGIYYI